MNVNVKREILETCLTTAEPKQNDSVSNKLVPFIELSSSSESNSGSDSDDVNEDAEGAGDKSGRPNKRRKMPQDLEVVLPVGFLEPLPSPERLPAAAGNDKAVSVGLQSCKQFWKAGDYEGAPSGGWEFSTGGMDHVRVHPKFLHSNATSHKWALGAFAELLDNSLDEVCNGATYSNIDMLINRKDGSRMLLIEDNGGGMNPDKMRHCMSLGYSAKSKAANTIGQYGNGFKTSTMRLGADVIVFSCCCGKDGKSPTRSIGLLSYTFLRSTGKEDIVVPMLDYEGSQQEWKKIIRSSLDDWNRNVETIVQWSPFSSEADLLHQFNLMKDHGTRIIIYNLWEDDQGLLELDFDSDKHDIQLRGVNRDEQNIKMAQHYPNSRHFLTYRHSLRSYASILYLRLPPGFRIIIRGKDVEHHNIVNDMMLSKKVTYRPQPGASGIPTDLHMAVDVTIGFVKDAKHHIDVQGFNVYHKNRLIKPFWRLWNASGSDGRGVIGVLEANFVEPAHDKQGFERTTVLARLEARLIQMQKDYWNNNCHEIGYAPRRYKKYIKDSYDRELSSKKSYPSRHKITDSSHSDKHQLHSNQRWEGKDSKRLPEASNYGDRKGHESSKGKYKMKTPVKYREGASVSEPLSPSAEDASDDDMHVMVTDRGANGSSQKILAAEKSFGKDGLHRTHPSACLVDSESQQDGASGGSSVRPFMPSQSKGSEVNPWSYHIALEFCFWICALLSYFTCIGDNLSRVKMSFTGPSMSSGGNTVRRAIEFGRTYVVRPKGKHQATVVWLHGLGDNGSSWSQLLETLPLPNIKWICPTAPTRPMTIFGGFPSTAWFDVGDLSEDVPDDLEGLDAAAAHVVNLLSTEPTDIKLGVGGFSMGAATALYSATCFAHGKYGNGNPYPAKLSAVVGLSGWLPCSKTLKNKLGGENEARRRAASLPILLCHGKGDDVVQYKFGEKSSQALTSNAFQDVIFKAYSGLGHYTCPEEMDEVCAWLTTKLGLEGCSS